MLVVMKFGGKLSVADLEKIRNVAETALKTERRGKPGGCGPLRNGKNHRTDCWPRQGEEISKMPSRH